MMELLAVLFFVVAALFNNSSKHMQLPTPQWMPKVTLSKVNR